MPSTAEWLAASPNFIGSAQAGSNFVTSLYDQAKKAQDDQAQTQAGKAFVAGDYAGATAALGNSGDIANAQKMQTAGQTSNKAGLGYITKALPVLQKIAAVHAAEGPQAQAAALVGAFRHLAPEAKQLTGVSDQVLQGLEQSFANDPQGTLDRLQAMVPTEFKTVGDSLVGIQGNQVTPAFEGSKYMAQPAGSAIVQVGGPQGQPGAVPSAPESPPAAAGGTDLFGGSVAPQAVAQVESRGDPSAVSPAGATGTMQTMPGTLQSPGYGVAPAQNGSPQEQTRVGEQYLTAMQQQFGNPVDALVAYNWGPGNAQKWVAGGRHWEQLPRETRDYLGKVAIAQVAGKQPPPLPPQAQQGGARIVSPPSSPVVWRDPSAAEKAAGVWQVNTQTGQKVKEPSALMTGSPETMEPTAQAIANYQMPPPSPRVAASPAGEALMGRVLQLNPKYQSQNFSKYQAGYKAFAIGKQGDTVRSLNTWVQHAQVLSEAAQALANGNVQAFNRVNNWWRTQTGSPLPTDFAGIANIYNDEGVKAILGSGGALGDREKFDQAMSSASSPAQIAGITRRYTQLAAGQLNSYRIQYKNSTGRDDFDTLLAPETVQALERHKGQSTASQYTPAQRAAMKKYGLQ